MTYVFNIDSKHNFYIKTAISYGLEDAYGKTVGNGAKQGQVILTVDDTTPPVLFYVASDDQRVAGRIVIKKITENSEIDIEKDILGKKTYRSGNNIQFTNGLMVYFSGQVTPDIYKNKRYIVEGVGNEINLVDFDTLKNNVDAANNLDTDFDVEPFDKFPFDDFRNAPLTPEYVTINRASRDLNPWTRYNRWFHKDVITLSAAANGVDPIYPVDKRGKRPIIEFRPNIKLYNFGYKAMPNVHLIDNQTIFNKYFRPLLQSQTLGVGQNFEFEDEAGIRRYKNVNQQQFDFPSKEHSLTSQQVGTFQTSLEQSKYDLTNGINFQITFSFDYHKEWTLGYGNDRADKTTWLYANVGLTFEIDKVPVQVMARFIEGLEENPQTIVNAIAEILRKEEYTDASDIYSYGMILW
jgi:hypothetical protein